MEASPLLFDRVMSSDQSCTYYCVLAKSESVIGERKVHTEQSEM